MITEHTLPYVIGFAAGGAWNMASIWCLVHVLRAWLGPQPSRRRAVAWLLVKLVALYPLAIWLLASQRVSVLAFGIGFTAVLVFAVAWFAVRAQRVLATPSHGR